MEVFGACGENRNFRTKIIEVIRDFAGSKFTTPAECAKKLVDPSPDRNGRVNSRKIFTQSFVPTDLLLRTTECRMSLLMVVALRFFWSDFHWDICPFDEVAHIRILSISSRF